ncbi:MAG: hypothetical protein Q4G65_06615 [bacterium]|nr:hypothetical protein [bacterium]
MTLEEKIAGLKEVIARLEMDVGSGSSARSMAKRQAKIMLEDLEREGRVVRTRDTVAAYLWQLKHGQF